MKQQTNKNPRDTWAENATTTNSRSSWNLIDSIGNYSCVEGISKRQHDQHVNYCKLLKLRGPQATFLCLLMGILEDSQIPLPSAGPSPHFVVPTHGPWPLVTWSGAARWHTGPTRRNAWCDSTSRWSGRKVRSNAEHFVKDTWTLIWEDISCSNHFRSFPDALESLEHENSKRSSTCNTWSIPKCGEFGLGAKDLIVRQDMPCTVRWLGHIDFIHWHACDTTAPPLKIIASGTLLETFKCLIVLTYSASRACCQLLIDGIAASRAHWKNTGQ